MSVSNEESSVDDNGRGLQFRNVIENTGMKDPGDSQISYVVPIDLVDVLESSIGEVIAMVSPIEVFTLVSKSAGLAYPQSQSNKDEKHHFRAN